MSSFYHETAIIEQGAQIGLETKIWHFCHVRSGSTIGNNCSIGRDCYVDSKVIIEEGSRIQNGVSIYNGVHIKQSVFVGPHVVFTNDMYPRAGSKKWDISPTVLEEGCSLGAGSIIRCGIKIGAFAMIGAGAIVTKDVPSFCLVTGVPAKVIKRICSCGRTQFDIDEKTWNPIQKCCSEYLSDSVLSLAKKHEH